MSVVPFAGTAPAALKTGLQNYKQTKAPEVGGDLLLRLATDGVWIYGQDNVDVQEGSQWAINPGTIGHGWCNWYAGDDRNELLGETMASFTEPPIPVPDDIPGGRGWVRQVCFKLACLNGEDKGVEVLYKVSSFGGRKEHERIVNAILAQLESDPENCVPIVEMESDHYMHKKWGKTYTPVFKIVSWGSMSGEVAPQGRVKDPEAEAAAEAEERAEEDGTGTDDKFAQASAGDETRAEDQDNTDWDEVAKRQQENRAQNPTRRRRAKK